MVNPLKNIFEQIEEGRERIRKRYKAKKIILYFQAFTNTYTSKKNLESIYFPLVNIPNAPIISIATRPDCIDKDVMDIFHYLKKRKELWVELGIETMKDITLKRLNRRHSSYDSLKAMNALKRAHVKIVAHIILGLPNETVEDMIYTINTIKDYIWGIKFHHLYVLKGTILEKMYKKGMLNLYITPQRYIEDLALLISYLKKGIVIHRLAGYEKFNLIAPEWTRNSRGIKDLLVSYMDKNDIFQGQKEVAWKGKQ